MHPSDDAPSNRPASDEQGVRLVRVIDEACSFDLADLFFSITDERGLIRHGNEVFRRLAGYPLAKMIGRPHSLIRHPDMPRCVFRVFWQFLGAGKPVVAYVKNRSSDGRHYWVLAYAMPCAGGFVSVRMKPCTEWFGTMENLYRGLLETERASGAQTKDARQAGMEAAGLELDAAVQELGFADYEALMQRILVDEVRTRAACVRQATPQAALTSRAGDVASDARVRSASAARPQTPMAAANAHLQHTVDQLFAVLTELSEAIENLRENSRSVVATAADMRILGINSVVSVSRLGPKGVSLGVISKALIDLSASMQRCSGEVDSVLAELCETLGPLLFDLSATALLGEQLDDFVRDSGSSDLMAVDEESSGSVTILTDQLEHRIADVFERLAKANDRLQELLRPVAALDRMRRSMFPMAVLGRKEAAPVDAAVSFRVVMDRLAEFEQALEAGLSGAEDRLRELADRSARVACRRASVEEALVEVQRARAA